MTTLTVPEVASILHVHEKTVLKIIDRCDIPAAKIGRAWVMLKEDVEAYVKKQVVDQTEAREASPVKIKPKRSS